MTKDSTNNKGPKKHMLHGINHFFANTWLEVWRLEKSEKKLVHKLQEKFEVNCMGFKL